MRRATAAVWIAIAASCSAVGRSLTVVSAMNTVWFWPTITWMPNGVTPGSGIEHAADLAHRLRKGRVTPVIITSASPSASSSAAKMLRSWLTIRSSSRRR